MSDAPQHALIAVFDDAAQAEQAARDLMAWDKATEDVKLGAIGLLIPALRFFASCGLTLLMVGAIGTHLANAQWGYAVVPLVLGAVAFSLAWTTRPSWLAERLESRTADAS